MKRFIALVLVFSVLCLPMEARRRWIPKVTAGTSFTPKDAAGGTPNSDINTQFYGGFISNFTASSSYTLTKIQLKMKKNGTGGGGNVTAYLISDVAGVPTTVLATSSSITAASLTGTATLTDFTGVSVSVASGTTYWVGFLQSTGPTSSGTDNVAISYNDNTGLTLKASDNGGSTWTAASLANLQCVFQLFTSP